MCDTRRRALPEVVDVVPVGVVPAGQEPDVALALRHALLEGLAHRHARRPLEELADDDARPAPLQVLQVLQKEGFNALTSHLFLPQRYGLVSTGVG